MNLDICYEQSNIGVKCNENFSVMFYWKFLALLIGRDEQLIFLFPKVWNDNFECHFNHLPGDGESQL